MKYVEYVAELLIFYKYSFGVIEKFAGSPDRLIMVFMMCLSAMLSVRSEEPRRMIDRVLVSLPQSALTGLH